MPLYTGEIIDTHQHLWDLDQFKIPWLDQIKPLNRSFLAADYAKASSGLKIRQAVYVEVNLEFSQHLQEIDYITNICENSLSMTTAAVIACRPGSASFEESLKQLKKNRWIKGLRQLLSHEDKDWCLEKNFVKAIQMLVNYQLSFDLCIRNDQLNEVTELVKLCPQTLFILDHCGNPHLGSLDFTNWSKDLSKLAKEPNVFCKISGILGNNPENLLPMIIHTCINAFGWDRVLFGSDWPVVNLRGSLKIWVEVLTKILREESLENQTKLFCSNAIRTYKL